MPDAKELSPEDIKALRDKYRVPDWTKPDEYKYADPKAPNPLTEEQLRWEFLRRDPAYRAAIEDEASPLHASDFGLYKWIPPSVRGDELGFRDIIFTDSVHRGGRLWTAAEVCKDLKNLDPSERDKLFALRFGEYVLNLEEQGYLLLVFDPRHPEKPQIARARKVFGHYREQLLKDEDVPTGTMTTNEEIEAAAVIKYKNRPDKPCSLLQVLDALNEDIPPIVFGREIYGDEFASNSEIITIVNERIAKARSCWRRM